MVIFHLSWQGYWNVCFILLTLLCCFLKETILLFRCEPNLLVSIQSDIIATLNLNNLDTSFNLLSNKLFKHHAHGVQEIGNVAQHWNIYNYTRRSILPKGAHPWAISISDITIPTMWSYVFTLNHSNHIGCHKGVGDFERAKNTIYFWFWKAKMDKFGHIMCKVVHHATYQILMDE